LNLPATIPRKYYFYGIIVIMAEQKTLDQEIENSPLTEIPKPFEEAKLSAMEGVGKNSYGEGDTNMLQNLLVTLGSGNIVAAIVPDVSVVAVDPNAPQVQDPAMAMGTPKPMNFDYS